MLAGIGVGLYEDAEDAYAHVRKPSAFFEPDKEAARQYAKLFPIYQQIYPALRSLNHELSTLV